VRVVQAASFGDRGPNRRLPGAGGTAHPEYILVRNVRGLRSLICPFAIGNRVCSLPVPDAYPAINLIHDGGPSTLQALFPFLAVESGKGRKGRMAIYQSKVSANVGLLERWSLCKPSLMFTC
jgi:hypothetical protein